MKRLTTYLILALMSICAVAQNRPKVALVLSGGGAKGAAHVGALKVLEEVGIPIDMIVGTSMGSLAGGLYAYGYNADQLDSILSCQDWMSLLMDKKPRIEMTLADRMMADKYALNIQFHKSPSEVLEGGILKGNSVAKLLCELTSDRLEPMDYSTLPIPFACVATDIAGNKEVDMTSGILAESMRSSMSIPGVFSPVRKGDMVLVDGGMENNYPVDLARKLGADIVIGVDVTTPAMSPDEIKTAPEVLSQILDNACKNKYHENVAQTDIHIRVNVDGYSSSSFKPEAIDTLMQRGVFATQQVMPQLLALRKQLGLQGTPVTPKPALHHVNNKNLPAVSTIYDPNEKKNWLGFGARFDDEENAAIILGGRYWFKHKIVPNVYTEIRLGERMWGKFGSNFQLGRNWWMDGGYKLTYANSKLYEDGDEKNDIEYVQNNAWLQFTKQWHNITFNLGGEFTQTNYDPLVVEEVESTGNSNYNGPFKPSHKNWWHERNVKYYVNAVFDNMDARAFPTRGVQWSVAYEYYTDNGATYNGDMGMHQASVKFRAAIPLTKNSTLLPRFAARYIPNDNFHYFNQNYIGGIDYDGRYLSQQISFAGIKYAQEANNFFGVVGATFRQSFPKNHFAFAVFNYGMGYGTGLIKGNGLVVQNTKNHTTENYYGTALGYGYRTPIGPIEADFGYSNQSRFSFTIQLGYKF